ncbi:TPA: type VI secretion system Vgr family protein [Enterobacter hormaechei]
MCFELRTDSWGAIRAQQDTFITADAQTKGQGQVLAMDTALDWVASGRHYATHNRTEKGI